MFLGVVIYSFIGQNFSKMVQSLQNFDNEYEETQELEKFFEVMKQFNNFKRMPKKNEK